MTLRLQNMMLAMLLALTTVLVGFGALSQNPTSGGYQLFERAAPGILADIQLASLGNFGPSPESASEYANATNRLPDFQQGTVNGQYTAINPGPLDDGLAGTFSGGRYPEVVLDQDVVLNRAGTGDRPLGQFFTQSAPDSLISTRIDSAVLPEWPGGGTSPLDTVFEVQIPAGTRVYVGEVSSQGGFYVGGTQQIVVPKPWLIDGVEVVGSTPLQ